jgi:hypothetical protein
MSDLTALADKGGRFTRQVANFLKQIFTEGGELPERKVQFRVQTHFMSEALLCGTLVGKGFALLAGRDGTSMLIDVASTRIVDRNRVALADVLSMTAVSNQRVALGTEDGLDVVNAVGQDLGREQASYKERVTTVAMPGWGNVPNVVTGSKEGNLRRWVVGEGLTIGSVGIFVDRVAVAKVGRSIQKILIHGGDLLVASGDDLAFVDEQLEVKRKVPVQFRIQDMAFFNEHTVIACGHNQLVHINLSKGTYTRILSAAPQANYLCVTTLNERTLCAGSEEGLITAIDFSSGEEIGSIKLDFPVRGMIPVGQRVLAYGGSWNSRGTAAAFVTWQESAAG